MINKTNTIPKEWKRVKLGDLCKIKKGEQLNKLDMIDYGEYPALNGGISPSGYTDKWNTEANTITVSEGGNSCGYVNFNKQRFWCGGHCYAIKEIGKDIDRNFLYQSLKSRQNDIMRLRVGSGLPNIQKRGIVDFTLLIPPINEQTKIAEILSSVDEEIKKVDQEIKKTEELKKGLMTKLLTKGIGHKKFKKTKLGMIPVEWEIVRLEDVAQVERGKFSNRPRNDPKFYGGDYPFIQTGDVVNSNGRIREYSQTLNEVGLAISRMFEKGTVVITIAANIGDTGILEFNSCFPDSLVGIIAKENMNNVFLEYYLRTRKDYLNSIATQSAQKNINLEKLRPLLIIKPKIEEQKQIAGILFAIDDKIDINKQIKNKLTELKKGLMQDLLSGRVRVI